MCHPKGSVFQHITNEMEVTALPCTVGRIGVRAGGTGGHRAERGQSKSF